MHILKIETYISMQKLILFIALILPEISKGQDTSKFEIYTDYGISIPVSDYSYHSNIDQQHSDKFEAIIEPARAGIGSNFNIGMRLKIWGGLGIKLEFSEIQQPHIKDLLPETSKYLSWQNYDYDALTVDLGWRFKLNHFSITPGLSTGIMKSAYTSSKEVTIKPEEINPTSTTIEYGSEAGFGIPLAMELEFGWDITSYVKLYCNVEYLYARMLWVDVSQTVYFSGPFSGNLYDSSVNYIKYFKAIQSNIGVKFKF